MLNAVDVYVLLKIIAMRDRKWNQRDVSYELSISPSMVNRALKTGEEVKLYNPSLRRVNAPQFEKALVNGARYFLAPKRGGEVRGMPTAWAALPLSNEIVTSEALPPVWPDPMGQARGLLVEPLHPSAPKAAKLDAVFYELLALVDVIRIGGARETRLAEKAFSERLHQK